MILNFLCCLCWLTIIKPQPALTSIQRTPLFKSTCLGPKGVLWIEVSLYKSSALSTWPLHLCIELTSPSLDSWHNHIVSYIPRTHITDNLQYLHEASDQILDLVHLGFYLLAIFCLHTAFYFTLRMNPPSPSLFVTLKVCLSCLGSLSYVKPSAITMSVVKYFKH